MLAALARRAEHVDAQVVVLDLDFDLVIDFGIDEHRRERRVAPRLRVERRDAHQAVHALLGLEEAVRVLSADLDFRRLDPRLFALQQVEHVHLEPVALGPAHVHAHQHLGPVLGFGAAGAGMDGEQRVARVVGTLQHVLQLEGLELRADRVGLLLQLALQREIDMGFRFQQLGELAAVGHAFAQRVIGLEPALQPLDLFYGPARLLRIRPHVPFRHGVLQLGQAFGLPVHVKENSAARRDGDRSP